MEVIQSTGLSKRYGNNWAVDHIDLRVQQGDIYGFIGRNGAGKSTTLKLAVRPCPAHTGLQQADPQPARPPKGGRPH